MRDVFFDASGKYIKDLSNMVQTEKSKYTMHNSSTLGDADALSEWKSNKELAKHMFLHTTSFEEFKKDNALILLGRTGVGKTAILMCIEDDVREKNTNAIECSYIVNINCNDLLIRLLESSDLFSENSTVALGNIKDFIKIFIKTVLMKEICTTKTDAPEVKYIKKYLEQCGLLKKRNWKTFIETFIDVARNTDFKEDNVNTGVALAVSVADMIKKLKNKGYQEAEDALTNHLSQFGRAVVLMDSLDEYDINSKELVLVIKCLIETCFDFYNSPDERILLKIALPAEIYNVILVRLPAKMTTNTVVIQWKTKELVTLLALRVYAAAKARRITSFDFNKDYTYNSFYYDIEPKAYENATKLLDNFLPKLCSNSLNSDFYTLPYCLRHTLKKPREIICIFNEIVDELDRKNDERYFINNPDKLMDIVHSTQDYMIRSALSMYESTYRSIYSAVKELFLNKYFVLNGDELSRAIKESVNFSISQQNSLLTTAEHIRKEYSFLDNDELTRIVLESGLIGNLIKSNIIAENHPELKNPEPLCVLVTDFNFSVSATLSDYTLRKEQQYILHPMCFENYNCFIDKNTLVYPGNDESDNLIASITA